jgi:ribosomal-protein-alanine N-acetyltransferase
MSTTQQLRTKRLHLRRIVSTDAALLWTIWRDQELIQYTYHRYTPELVDSEERVRQILTWYGSRPESQGPFLAFTTEGDFVGICGLDSKSAELQEYDVYYLIVREQQGKGYATEVTRALIDLGFEELAAERIMAEVVDVNEASSQVLTKVGMLLEGRMRRKFYRGKAFHDLLIYAILRSDWLGIRSV